MRTANGKDADERRLNHRYETHDLVCALGKVADVSRTGARVLSDGAPPVRPGQSVCVRLVAGGKKLVLSAEVVRVRRVRPLSKERSVGLRFVGLSPRHEAALENLGRFGTFVPGADQAADPTQTGPSPCASAQATSDADPTSSCMAGVSIELPDLYEILGAPPSSTHEELRAAFRKLATRLHPDVNPDPEAHERFQEVVSAWQILGDPELRARFDQRRHAAA